MSLDEIVVFLFSIGGIIFTFWFFLMRKEDLAAVEGGEVDILVQGGYKPEAIEIPAGKTTKINFLRKDRSSCLEEVILPEFKIKKFLPVGKKVSIEITPKEKGEFRFSCGMNMFHGKVIVK